MEGKKEGTMDMTSNASKSTAAPSAPDNHQQEAVVSSPTENEQARETRKPPASDLPLICPRCCSTNTKFCYYNNYNLDQPRYSCKACHRYWTHGGSIRDIPVGSGSRRNKRASGSSSSSSSAASRNAGSSAAVAKTVERQRIVLKAATTRTKTTPSPPPATAMLPNEDMPPTFTPTDGSGFDVAMGDQQGFLPLSPFSLSDQAPELAPAESDTTPSFLEMLTSAGYFNFNGGGSDSSYGGGLAMTGGYLGMEMDMDLDMDMDMSFLLPSLPEMWAPTTDQMQMQLAEGMDDVADEPLWAPSEFDSYINYDGGYAAGPAAGVPQEQQQVVGDQQQEEDNKAAEESSNNKDDGGPSSVHSNGVNTNKSDGKEG